MNILVFLGLVVLGTNAFGISELLFWYVMSRLCMLGELILTGGLFSALLNYSNYRYLVVSSLFSIGLAARSLFVFCRELGYVLVDAWNGTGDLKEKVRLMWKMGREYTYHQTRRYLFPPVIRRGKNFVMNYSIGMTEYSILLPRVRKSNHVIMVLDESNSDVTEEVKKFLGPRENWHGSLISPSDLGYQSLHFELSDGSNQDFEGDQVMNILQ